MFFSGLRIRDVYPGSRSDFFLSRVKKIPDPDPHERTEVLLIQKIVSEVSEILSGMFIPGPDPGVKKALDPGSGSATLFYITRFVKFVRRI
jgi:hypothetical protein